MLLGRYYYYYYYDTRRSPIVVVNATKFGQTETRIVVVTGVRDETILVIITIIIFKTDIFYYNYHYYNRSRMGGVTKCVRLTYTMQLFQLGVSGGWEKEKVLIRVAGELLGLSETQFVLYVEK